MYILVKVRIMLCWCAWLTYIRDNGVQGIPHPAESKQTWQYLSELFKYGKHGRECEPFSCSYWTRNPIIKKKAISRHEWWNIHLKWEEKKNQATNPPKKQFWFQRHVKLHSTILLEDLWCPVPYISIHSPWIFPCFVVFEPKCM